jgi:hypothetical protein
VCTQNFVSTAFGVGTATDVAIAALMCWRLLANRTGWSHTDSVIWTLITYTLNSGVLTAFCVIGGLVSSVAGQKTEFELFFLLLLPDRASCSTRAACSAANAC